MNSPKTINDVANPLTGKKAKEWIIDAYGFIHWLIDHDGKMSTSQIVQTFEHDIIGLAQEQPCFLSRLSGYARFLKEADRKRLGV